MKALLRRGVVCYMPSGGFIGMQLDICYTICALANNTLPVSQSHTYTSDTTTVPGVATETVHLNATIEP